MPCEHFQDALIEAAASGADVRGELRAHLKNCAACQAAFEREQSLFGAIDSGVRVVANAEVPPSLLPRVRAALDQTAAPKLAWPPKWFVPAGAMVAFFFVTQALWRARFEPMPSESAINPVQSLPPARVVSNEAAGSMTAANSGAVIHRTHAGAERIAMRQGISGREAEPEVLVPRDEEDLLVSYASEWSQRKSAPLVAASFDPTNFLPLQIAPIQIAQLDVKPMTEEQAQ